jgi:hypothetical protein
VPHLAALVNTDDAFRIFRRFGSLRGRLILQRQIEIVELEQQLEKLDKSSAVAEKSDWKLQPEEVVDDDWDSVQKNLLSKLEDKIVKYGTPY